MNKIISEDYADLIIDNEIIAQYQNENEDNITPINNKHSMLHVPITEIEKCSIGKYNYNFFPSCFTLASLGSLDKSSVIEVQKNSNLALFGEGVLIGFVDTGIAAGNFNEAESFSGVIPKAEFVIVKLKEAKQIMRDLFCIPSRAICYQDTDILMGIRYIVSVATKLQKPLVICIGLGTNQGGHNGLGAVSTELDALAQVPKICTVIAAGNEGISRRHYWGKIEKGEPTKEFELNVGISDTLFSMEIWAQTPYRIALDITSPGNAPKSITITSYNHQSGGIAINASRGYTPTNIIKPDLAAPGVDLTCPLIGNTYGTASRTGCATAHTAGIAAMLMEWGIVKGNYTSLNGQDIQKFLIRGATRSDDLEYPNNVWGYGKVNIYNVFQRLR